MRQSTLQLVADELWSRRWFVGVFVLLGFVASMSYATFSDRMYVSEVIVIPSRHDDGLSVSGSLGSTLGSLGALAGMGAGHSDQSKEAIALLKSRGFIEEFIEDNDLLPMLFFDDWDSESIRWQDLQDAPTLWDGYEFFSEDVLSVTEDVNLGLIYIRVTWKDTDLSADWANLLVQRINEAIRQRVIVESEASLEFLQNEMAATGVLEVRQRISNLMEQQISYIALANVRPDYAFKVIDSARPKDLDAYDFPRASVLVPAGMLLGLVFAILLGTLRIVLAPRRSQDD